MSYTIKPHSAQFKMGISDITQFNQWLEEHNQIIGVAFVGRSNVGKSSLINSLFGGKTARVSKTPGRTREINIFEFKLNLNNETAQNLPPFYLIDLPGYGFAEVSKDMQKNWDQLMGAFFALASPHLLLVNLQDARHPNQKVDKDFYNFISHFEKKTILVFNKLDKLKTQKERNELEKLKPLLSKEYKWIRQMYFASAESKKGIPQVEDAIVTNFLEELEMRKITQNQNLEFED